VATTTTQSVPETYQVADLPDGTYVIKNINSGFYLAEANGNVVQSSQQIWTLTRIGDGIYTVQTADGKRLTVEGTGGENGYNLSLQDATEEDTQKFILRVNEDGTYALLTFVSGGTHCADVYGISLEDGANICQWEYWGGDGQKFLIEPYSTAIEEPEESGTMEEKGELSEQPSESATLQGDVNLDGIITVADLVLLQKYLLQDVKLSEAQWLRADLAFPSGVDGFDLTMLRQILVG
jgi:arabinan endo-1,5-alpha-L-arabinosidase